MNPATEKEERSHLHAYSAIYPRTDASGDVVRDFIIMKPIYPCVVDAQDDINRTINLNFFRTRRTVNFHFHSFIQRSNLFHHANLDYYSHVCLGDWCDQNCDHHRSNPRVGCRLYLGWHHALVVSVCIISAAKHIYFS